MATSKNKEEKEEKRPKKGARIEAMMEQYLQIKTKQTEAEVAHLANEKVADQGLDFSIKRCVTILNGMEVSKQEKAKAYSMFIKSKENREAFLCACELDPETALIWLQIEIA
ncbi:hypothetical protein QOZ80_9BG0709100 [Eleusine coracana subsp. coracana]|nr:hypothetical protein QOZ80_9BG0709100 [Eleusine coracana subsp. coracana]